MLACVTLALAILGGCSERDTSQGRANQITTSSGGGVEIAGRITPTMPPASASSTEEDGQWTMPFIDYANTRFSGLTQITQANAENLEVAFTFTFASGTTSGQESAPLVVGSTLYFVTP